MNELQNRKNSSVQNNEGDASKRLKIERNGELPSVEHPPTPKATYNERSLNTTRVVTEASLPDTFDDDADSKIIGELEEKIGAWKNAKSAHVHKRGEKPSFVEFLDDLLYCIVRN